MLISVYIYPAAMVAALVGVLVLLEQVDDLADPNCLEKILDALGADSNRAVDPEVEVGSLALGTIEKRNNKMFNILRSQFYKSNQIPLVYVEVVRVDHSEAPVEWAVHFVLVARSIGVD